MLALLSPTPSTGPFSVARRRAVTARSIAVFLEKVLAMLKIFRVIFPVVLRAVAVMNSINYATGEATMQVQVQKPDQLAVLNTRI